MLRELISFRQFGIDLDALLWGLGSAVAMYLLPTCLALAAIAFAWRQEAKREVPRAEWKETLESEEAEKEPEKKRAA